MMQEILHCNKCSVKYSAMPQMQFFLGDCGHIFCDKCNIRVGEIKKCLVCNKATVTIKIDQEMDPNIFKFFCPLEKILQNATEIYKFQNQHAKSFTQFLLRKYNDAKKRCISYHFQNQKLMQENRALKSALSGDGQRPSFVTSTPAFKLDGSLISSENTNAMNMSAGMSSITFTPGQNSFSFKYPGYPKRMVGGNNMMPSGDQMVKNYGVHNSFGPSPSQMIPNVNPQYLTPVHTNRPNKAFIHGIPKK